MLAAPNRLAHARDISRVYARGRYVAGDGIAIKYLASHKEVSRAVVVVGKKVSKKAVVRNRIRRRLAAILFEEWKTVAPGYDIVIVVRSDIHAATPQEMHALLINTLTKAKLLIQA